MNLPNHVRPIEKEAKFTFRCHAGLKCFTDCCRDLELALTPYDVFRLRQALAIGSRDFLDRHTLIEFAEEDQFPRVYLGMVDDGKASCPFVQTDGCFLYADRPAACRTYPVGRGASMAKNKKVMTRYVLLHEPHCHGFDSSRSQTIAEWEDDQQITLYNHFNDLLMAINQHPKIKTGQRLSPQQADLYINTLYDLDGFRSKIVTRLPPDENLHGLQMNELLHDDSILLTYACTWLCKQLF